jgi:hypothetical protein
MATLKGGRQTFVAGILAILPVEEERPDVDLRDDEGREG